MISAEVWDLAISSEGYDTVKFRYLLVVPVWGSTFILILMKLTDALNCVGQRFMFKLLVITYLKI